MVKDEPKEINRARSYRGSCKSSEKFELHRKSSRMPLKNVDAIKFAFSRNHYCDRIAESRLEIESLVHNV
jgi:hypothetical protein